MKLDEALAPFPEDSPYPAIITALVSAEPTERSSGGDLIRKHKLIAPYWEKAEPKEEALAVVRAAVELSYPPPEHDWERGPEDLIMTILGSGHPSVLAYVAESYGRADERLRLDLLTLVASAVADTALSRGLAARLDALMTRLAELRGGDDEEDASQVARELAMQLDLAGFVGGSETIAPTLQRAAALPESWPAAFAVASLIRRGEEATDADIVRIAGDHSTRNTLYSLLDGLEATARIPEPQRSRDAFAAADMVAWLSHPGELGCPPDAIEQMGIFEAIRDGEPVVLYVWRFRTGDEPWLAAVSGVYPAAAPEGPLSGSDTFSRFEAWDSQSAEEHAVAILDNLAEWHRAWAARDAD